MRRLRPLIALGALLLVAVAVVLANRGGEESASGSAASSTDTSIQSDIGFRSTRKLEEHYVKHGREFGDISQDEYLRRAQILRDRPAGGPILEDVRRDGVVTRFDKDGGSFLAANADRTIRTFFRPNDGEEYFRRQARR